MNLKFRLEMSLLCYQSWNVSDTPRTIGILSLISCDYLIYY